MRLSDVVARLAKLRNHVGDAFVVGLGMREGPTGFGVPVAFGGIQVVEAMDQLAISKQGIPGLEGVDTVVVLSFDVKGPGVDDVVDTPPSAPAPRPDHVCCVLEIPTTTWCGRRVPLFDLEFVFQNATHAVLNAKGGGRLLLCPQCTTQLVTMLQAGTWREPDQAGSDTPGST